MAKKKGSNMFNYMDWLRGISVKVHSAVFKSMPFSDCRESVIGSVSDPNLLWMDPNKKDMI